MLRYLVPSLLCLFISCQISGQPVADEWYYGFKAGATYGQTTGVAATIIPSGFPEDTYTAETVDQVGFLGGLFLYHRFYKSRFAVQPEVLFIQQGSDFRYTDVNELEYTISLNYQFVSVGTEIKFYPAGGLHLGLGMRAAFNVAPDRLMYVSNMPELGPDLQIQQSLRETIFGRNDLNFLVGAGYDFKFGLSFDFRYRLGLRDTVETGANGFGFTEHRNKTAGYQATVGWLIPFPAN